MQAAALHRGLLEAAGRRCNVMLLMLLWSMHARATATGSRAWPAGAVHASVGADRLRAGSCCAAVNVGTAVRLAVSLCVQARVHAPRYDGCSSIH